MSVLFLILSIISFLLLLILSFYIHSSFALVMQKNLITTNTKPSNLLSRIKNSVIYYSYYVYIAKTIKFNSKDKEIKNLLFISLYCTLYIIIFVYAYDLFIFLFVF